MREILFRGKCKETGNWFTGQYINLHKTTYCVKEDYEADKENDIHQIVFEKMTDWGLPNKHLRVDVIPETVGQFTGLTYNGTKIFEGDIVKARFKPLTGGNKKCFAVGKVVFENGTFKICVYISSNTAEYKEFTDKNAKKYPIEHNFIDRGYKLEVIGNIHDNPELLKGENNA